MPLILISIPIIISWILILFAPNVYYLYASRLLNGFFGGGAYTIVPLYLSDFAFDRIRGTLVSSLILSENFGMLLGFTLGHFYNFYIVPQFVISLMALFAVLLFFFPETPVFLVKQNKICQAEKSIRFYQNLSDGEKENKLVEIEINRLRIMINHEQVEKSTDKSFKWSELTTKSVRKALTIAFVLVILTNFSGVSAMLNYTASIFEEAGSNLHPNISTIVVGAIQLFGTAIATKLVDLAGRKSLYAVSNIGTALGLIVLGTYIILKSQGYPVEHFNWVPVISFSFTIFVAALGIVSLPLTLFSEIMPEKMKDFGVTSFLTLMWFSSFLLIKYLPMLTKSLGFDMSMFIFAAVCLACQLFIIYFVPETKGKSHKEIINMLHNKEGH
ncbi:facilitated trehalose transporter Tret1-like isoform X1 [Sitodiplosis mosellana]|uniref:facilitated trehalose transporter Tret1-like isoform X1 n=1 Tax=Sitodiplosis mosellana TaxID=263140 RepID=UPI002444B5ED|nr:facilitated trehalose transporter Tret1-like isoform X1 [Sitodiplosis mosellana]